MTLALPPISSSNGDWNDPTNAQYHIQTDEGPERHFKYQTQSGQYRKEKRLEDGTVIGTYAWIDSDGILRLKDYIADDQGYRILRTKNAFVGKDTTIQAAIKSAKKLSKTSGIFSNHNEYHVTQKPPPSYQQNLLKYNVLHEQLIPNNQLSLATGHISSLPAQKPRLMTTESPQSFEQQIHMPTTILCKNYDPLSTIQNAPSNTLSNTYLPSSTQTPYENPKENCYKQSTPSNVYIPNVPTLSHAVDKNAIDYSNLLPYAHKSTAFVNPYIYENGPTYPIDKNGHTFNSYTNKLENAHDPQYELYDDVSVTNDGFRYYIPKAYHEEQTLPGDKRSGSFGYVDPFGIRRVIYYNTAPGTGFQYRNNNRYVGLNAMPYDPRPY